MTSSDALEQQFGPTKLEVLRQDAAGRTICTKTESGRVLELSRVVFRPEGIAAFPDVHHKIVSGASIGKAFAEAGIAFKRSVHASGRCNAPAEFAFGSNEAATVTDVSVFVGADSTPYADILEVYHPEVKPWEPSGKLDPSVIARLEEFGRTLGQNP